MRSHLVLFGFLLAACNHDEPQSTTPQSSASTAATSAPLGANASGSAGVPARNIPKLETVCSSDNDCVVTSQDIDTSTACCPGCTNHAGNQTWYKQFQAACASTPATACPAIGCAMPEVRAACVNHACAAVVVKK